ncbi:MAG TPA: YceI family protein [Bacteroidales bacterium]|nr:YceI family protein [Bacteroidales bacterium]
MNIKKSGLLICITILTLEPVTRAQVYELSPAGSKVIITGTSSLHDWEMDVKHFTSSFQLDHEGLSVKNIRKVIFNCKAHDIKSDNSLMDKKTYDALKADEFPEISFSGTTVSDLISEGTSIKGNLKGTLSLAGQKHEITIPFKGTLKDRIVDISASAELTFSGYGMQPPTAMLGTLKTGDKVKVNFTLQYNQKDI